MNQRRIVAYLKGFSKGLEYLKNESEALHELHGEGHAMTYWRGRYEALGECLSSVNLLIKDIEGGDKP